MERIRITKDNINLWTRFESLFNSGELKFDSKGRLRYLHGAPVGDMIKLKIGKDGNPIYQETSRVV